MSAHVDEASQLFPTITSPTAPAKNTSSEPLFSEDDESPVSEEMERKYVRSDTINYDAQRMIGHGSFGAVFMAKVAETNELVAIKKVLQDKRFKNRELQIMKLLAKNPHPYVIAMKNHFITMGSKSNDVYLNLVLEYVPETIYSVAKQYSRLRQPFSMLSIKFYMYQLARALAHIHGLGICHRDIKPQNLLVDPARQVLKLCDFGSAKALVAGEPNVAYICSRYYRAPELIFGAIDYTTAIDVWSQGCVFAELLIGTVLFPGSTGVDQLVEIIRVLGTPSKEQLRCMNPSYQDFKFPPIRAHAWETIFKAGTPPEAIDLITKLLDYIPQRRIKPIEACAHSFFDELRNPTCRLPNGSLLQPELFQFTQVELGTVEPHLQDGLLATLIPPHQAPMLDIASAAVYVTTSISEAVAVAVGVLDAQAPFSHAISSQLSSQIVEDHSNSNEKAIPSTASETTQVSNASTETREGEVSTQGTENAT